MQLPVDCGETENRSVSSFFLHNRTYNKSNNIYKYVHQHSYRMDKTYAGHVWILPINHNGHINIRNAWF